MKVTKTVLTRTFFLQSSALSESGFLMVAERWFSSIIGKNTEPMNCAVEDHTRCLFGWMVDSQVKTMVNKYNKTCHMVMHIFKEIKLK